MKHATALQSHHDALQLDVDDFVRVVYEDDRWLAVIANAFDHGFSTCWPAGSSALLDLVCDAWRASGDLERSLEAAIDDWFELENLTIQHGEPDEWLDPAATIGAIDSTGAVLTVGEIEVWVLDNGTPTLRTIADTLRNQHARQKPQNELPADVPDVITRAIGRERRNLTRNRAQLADADTVVLANRPRDLRLFAARPDELAQSIAAQGAGTSARFTACAVLALHMAPD